MKRDLKDSNTGTPGKEKSSPSNSTDLDRISTSSAYRKEKNEHELVRQNKLRKLVTRCMKLSFLFDFIEKYTFCSKVITPSDPY